MVFGLNETLNVLLNIKLIKMYKYKIEWYQFINFRIEKVWHRKAVIKDWYSNSNTISVSGKIELFQQTEYDPVDFEINLQGVQGGNDYFVYSVSCYIFIETIKYFHDFTFVVLYL